MLDKTSHGCADCGDTKTILVRFYGEDGEHEDICYNCWKEDGQDQIDHKKEVSNA